MKISRIITATVLSAALMCGCSNAGDTLNYNEDTFIAQLDNFENKMDRNVPKSVLDTLDYMIENYTGGVSIPDPNKTQTILPSGQTPDKIDGTEPVAGTKEELEAIILAALRETKPNAVMRIDKSVVGNQDLGNLLLEVLNYDIGSTYIIDSLGAVNYFEYSWSESQTEYAVDLTFSYFRDATYDYGFSLDDVKRMKLELKAKAEQVVNNLDLNNLSEYEKVYTVNRYLSDTVEYTSGNPPYKMMSHTPYGALMYGDCVCEGYAKSAQLLFSLCGIDSYYVQGDTAGGGHAWNLVKVDGNWYQLDITWNDVDMARDQYFLVTDDYMKLSRTWEYNKFPPSAKKPYKK